MSVSILRVQGGAVGTKDRADLKAQRTGDSCGSGKGTFLLIGPVHSVLFGLAQG